MTKSTSLGGSPPGGGLRPKMQLFAVTVVRSGSAPGMLLSALYLTSPGVCLYCSIDTYFSAPVFLTFSFFSPARESALEWKCS